MIREVGVSDNPLKNSSANQVTQQSKALLGDVLLRRGQIRKYQLEFALALQMSYRRVSKKTLIGDILIRHRIIDNETLERALDEQEDSIYEPVTQILRIPEEKNEQTNSVIDLHEEVSEVLLELEPSLEHSMVGFNLNSVRNQLSPQLCFD